METHERLLVRSVVRVILSGVSEGPPESVRAVTLENEEGLPIFETDGHS